jgi:predicted ATP-dependent protease
VTARSWRKAVAQGRFHIYPVRTIDEGLELLTGISAAGKPGVEPINDAAARRLKELVVGLKDFVALAHNGGAEMKE